MVPRKFNIVEFDGFDLAGQYGEVIPGIYDKIVDAHWNCVYIMCFGLKFAGFDIAPQYMIPEMFSDHIMLNGIISIDQNDVITVPSIEPPPIEPVILPGIFENNGVYHAPSGLDGYNPVTVEVDSGGGAYFGKPLVPVDYDYSGGAFMSGGMWYPTGGGPTRIDIYSLEANKRYFISLCDPIGNRFRASYYQQNPTSYTSRTQGVVVVNTDSPVIYSVAPMFLTPYSGFLAIQKVNDGVTGIKTYVFEVFDWNNVN